ncbi:formyl transferase [Sphingomonas solaris]|uniref:Formyl transferase n=1 Tax=Alterirhizorhabdus solaris TaxID=2529389 RepID=A0A558R568_9SPHN|nr:formyl transferase [Sphingomonas solaris]
METIVARGGIDGLDTLWMPEEPDFSFLADPFGLWRDGVLHIFAEHYDYRDRHGRIVCLRFDAALHPIDRQEVLSEAWHLSYPCVFEADGEIWMLPEAHRSGTLTLYRAGDFPHRWAPASHIVLDGGAVDATPFRHEGRWWLAYASARDRRSRQADLRLAFADRLEGPWTAHPGNPIRSDLAGGRPGGTPFVLDDKLNLPVQDGTGTYGAAIRILTFDRLDPAVARTSIGAPISAPADAGRYREGLHTLSACGAVTLVDVKRVDRTGRGWLIDLRRRLRAG